MATLERQLKDRVALHQQDQATLQQEKEVVVQQLADVRNQVRVSIAVELSCAAGSHGR